RATHFCRRPPEGAVPILVKMYCLPPRRRGEPELIDFNLYPLGPRLRGDERRVLRLSHTSQVALAGQRGGDDRLWDCDGRNRRAAHHFDAGGRVTGGVSIL